MTFLIFLLLCFVSTAVGIGTLHLLGFRKEDGTIFISSPLIALCIWSLALGIGVSLRVPVRILTYLIWGVSIVLCLVAFKQYQYKQVILPLIASLLMALFISFPYVLHGFSDYIGSPLADGWSYIAFGQYLWEYPRCAEGGLASLYQYAAHLCHTRFIAPSLLGFISPLAGWPGDTQAASGYFFPWAIFVYGSACMFFIQKRVSQLVSWGYVFICVVTGWLFTIMIANNFDQALAIGFLPAIAGFLESLDFAKMRWGILLAIVLSSIVYIYPEMTPFIFLSAFLLLLYQIVKGRVLFVSLARLGGVFIFVFALLVAAYFSTWFNFILAQISIVQASVRPGEGIASELLSKEYWWMGIWGLGGDINMVDWLRKICALVFLVLSIIGFLVLIKNKNWGLLAVQILLSALVAYFMQVQKYSYGAYKIITLLWWLVAYMVILAIPWLQARSYIRFISILSKAFYIFAIIMVAYVNFAQWTRFDRNLSSPNIEPYKQLLSLQPIVKNAPLGISVSDPIANTWAMYYLRKSITYFFSYQGYPNQPHVLPFMLRSQPVDLSKIKYLLTDRRGFRPEGVSRVWHNSVYSLWEIEGSPFFIAGIVNPNGIDIVNNKNFYWLNNQKTLIDIQSPSAGIISMVGDFSMGPALPEMMERNLMVTSIIDGKPQSFTFTIRSGRNTIEVPVSRGINKIELSVLDEPTVDSLPSGDPRVLLLGLENIQIQFENEVEPK